LLNQKKQEEEGRTREGGEVILVSLFVLTSYFK